MPRVFGLTGGIACGKSTVSRVFAEAGVPIVDADLVAREVVAPGTVGLQRLVGAFGGDILQDDQTLDRAKLGAKIFLDLAQRVRLNDIMHPLIAERSAELMRQHLDAGADLVCYDAPTLIEAGVHEKFRPLVVVVVPLDVQLHRLMQRDGFTYEQAHARVSSQIPMSEKAELADFVIENTGTVDELRTRALEVLSGIKEVSW